MCKIRRVFFLAGLAIGAVFPAVRILPTPQYLEPLPQTMHLGPDSSIVVMLGPKASASNSKIRLAAEFLRRELSGNPQGARLSVEEFAELSRAGNAIYLWNHGADPNPPIQLSILDRQTLSDPGGSGQSYVIRMPDRNTLWVIGSSDQGILLGAMSILQLIERRGQGVDIRGAYIRDFPDFEFRTADWLLNVEINRWALDRGQGFDAFEQLCRRKLDQALRFKINMVLIDGFGWGLEQRFPEYGKLMRGLNHYARERGIHLLYGGYGASYGIAYQTGPLYEEGAYLGKVFENRESYPNGRIYRCMGFPREKAGPDPSTLGSCRSNEELNKLKAEELRAFVDAVEPGALYIHHEDFGGFEGTQKVWQERCPRCRVRWPNDSLMAQDGGAGGLANGYSALISAIRSVKHSASGYDASRDCQIILVSPVYVPDSPESGVWARVLELWRNIGLQLPKTGNVQVCFRETFPQQYGAAKWTQLFRNVTTGAGLNLGIFLFFAGGADNYLSDYPLSGVPAMNAMFQGARSMYNASGDFFREPMELIHAEYSWNVRSTGFFRDPLSYKEAESERLRYMQPGEPPQMFGTDGIYEAACNLLYGPAAGPIMAAYYKESAWLPDTPGKPDPERWEESYLPMTWDRAYAVPSHWRHLALDAKTWSAEIINEAYLREMARLKINRKELHRRLARRWLVLAQLNAKGAEDIAKALAAGPLPDAVEDLRFLQTCFRVYQPFTEALADYHHGLEEYFSEPANRASAAHWLDVALPKALRAQQLAADAFPTPLDPVGGEVGSARRYSAELVKSVGAMIKHVGEQGRDRPN